MVHAFQKHGGSASPEVKKIAKGISFGDADKFASTKHKGLPERKKKKKSKKKGPKSFREWLQENHPEFQGGQPAPVPEVPQAPVSKVCELCKELPPRPGERYCDGCRRVMLSQMKRSNYLTKTGGWRRPLVNRAGQASVVDQNPWGDNAVRALEDG